MKGVQKKCKREVKKRSCREGSEYEGKCTRKYFHLAKFPTFSHSAFGKKRKEKKEEKFFFDPVIV